MIPLCPYRAACLAKWNVTRTDYRCGFEIANTIRSCPRYAQHRQTEATREGRMDTDHVEQPDRDHLAGRLLAAHVQLSLGV